MVITSLSNLLFDGDWVGQRVNYNGKVYDISKDELDLLVEDFNVKLVTGSSTMGNINLMEVGDTLVPVNATNEKELTYHLFAKLIGKERLTKTDIELKKMYNHYNKLVFNNELPKDVVVYWTTRMTSSAGICSYSKDKWGLKYYDFSIGLSVPYHEKYKDEIVDTLVHEMIHVKYPRDGHGYSFKSEMSRINSNFGLNLTIKATGRATDKKVNYIYACRSCGTEYKRVRRHKNDYKYATCGISGCRGSIYLKENLKEHVD